MLLGSEQAAEWPEHSCGQTTGAQLHAVLQQGRVVAGAGQEPLQGLLVSSWCPPSPCQCVLYGQEIQADAALRLPLVADISINLPALIPERSVLAACCGFVQ